MHFTSGAQRVRRIIILHVGKSVRIAPADGRYIPRCGLFINMVIDRSVLSSYSLKLAFIVLLIRLALAEFNRFNGVSRVSGEVGFAWLGLGLGLTGYSVRIRVIGLVL